MRPVGLDYRRSDFPFGDRVLDKLRPAFADTLNGSGAALVKGLPRAGVSAEEFELLTWAIGLHFGVARPQDKLSRYMNMVKDVGVEYRSPTGRGLTRDEMLGFYEGKIAKWWTPDDVVFVDAIPLGATGKMQKNKLRDQLRDYRLPIA